MDDGYDKKQNGKSRLARGRGRAVRMADLQRGGGMCSAEKLLIAKQDQRSPMHSYALKAEVISSGGVALLVSLFGSDDRGRQGVL